MSKVPVYNFEWDPAKARANLRKHGVPFERGATVFNDPHTVSIYDHEHSQDEDRWITMGRDRSDRLLVVHHTFKELTPDMTTMRLFSVRRATRNEAKQYERK